jgi:uncharacterized membrane protein YGL010W
MPTTEQCLVEYGESHQHGTNKLIHWVCVSLVMFSLIGLLRAISLNNLQKLFPHSISFFVNWGTLFLVLALLFYLRLSVAMFLGMLLITVLMVIGVYFIMQHVSLPLWALSLSIFAGAWVGQFVGHEIEGKKLSFLKDVQFLLISPAWLLSFIYKKMEISY